MKNGILVLMASFLSASAFAAELPVSQVLTTPYYAEFLAPVHIRIAFGFMDDELRKYDCLAGKTDAEITKKARTRIFGNDIPGEYKLTYETKCFGADLKGVRFYVSSIGYDEDYTQVVLELKTKSKGTLYPELCIYGPGEVRKCPAGMFERPTTFSKPTAN